MTNNLRNSRFPFANASGANLGPNQWIATQSIILSEHEHISSFGEFIFHCSHEMNSHLFKDKKIFLKKGENKLKRKAQYLDWLWK
jgi:hypothetical protein